MEIQVLLAYIDKAGTVAAVLELGALIWIVKDRGRILEQLTAKESEVRDLAVQVITIATELRMFLFNERKAP